MEILVQYENQQNTNETHDIVEEELVESVTTSFKKIQKSEGFLQCKGVVTILNRGGANFMSKSCKGKIFGTTEKGHREINLFLKHQVHLNDLNIINTNDMYTRELFMYIEFSEVINELQAEYSVPEAERFKLTKCYDNNRKTIILDDLSSSNFIVPDRFNAISLDCAEHAVETLAKFHALSFVLSEKRSDFFSKHIQPMRQMTQYNEDWERIVAKLTDITLKRLVGQNKIERVAKFAKKVTEKLQKYMTESPSGIKVLCHGDYRLANMLVREKDGTIADFMPIDYQVSYYGCPVHDIVYLIYGASDRAFRDQHVPRLLRLYHAAMRRFLGHFNLDVDHFYPMKAFQQDYEERKDYGLITGITFLAFFLASDSYSPDYAQSMTDWSMDLNHEVFDKRIGEIVEEFMESGDI